MVTIKILVNGADISVQASGGLTVGMAGAAYEVEYDPSWNGLSKIVIFRAGLNQMVALDGRVPSGVLTTERTMLRVGVEGRNQDGGLVIPTIWADVGYVLPSASTDGASNLDPDNPAWAQSAAIAQQALDKAEHLEQRADSGEFRGEPGPQGPGYTHSEEFSSLANRIHSDAVTAENAAKQAGRNTSLAVSASKGAEQSAIAAQAEASRAKQEADRAAQAGGGLTGRQKELMLTVLRAGVYSSDQSDNLDMLEASFAGGIAPEPPDRPEAWAVTNTLTHCTSSNSTAAVTKGQPYNATLTASEGYTMEGAAVTVLMGGADMTGQVYESGAIHIDAVTGDIAITAAAKAAPSAPMLPQLGLQAYFDCTGNGEEVTEFPASKGENPGIKLVSNGQNLCTKQPKGAELHNGPYNWLTVNGYSFGDSWTIVLHDFTPSDKGFVKIPEYMGRITDADSHGGKSMLTASSYVTKTGQKKKVSSYGILFQGAENVYRTLILSASPDALTFYFDGAAAETTQSSALADFASWETDFIIRNEKGASSGLLSHVLLYNRALSAEEAQRVIDYMKTQEAVA